MRTRACLDCLARTRELVGETPLVPMTYAALLEAYGWERFAVDARSAGATSLIVADLPAGERPELTRVQLVAPTSTDERVRLAAEQTDGWLYLVTVTGTTGRARPTLSPALARARRAGARRHRRAALRRLRHLDARARTRGRRARGRDRRRLACDRGRGRGWSPASRSARLRPLRCARLSTRW